MHSAVPVNHRDGRTSARFEVQAGQRVPFVLTYAPAPLPVHGLQTLGGHCGAGSTTTCVPAATMPGVAPSPSCGLDAALLLIPRLGFLPWGDTWVVGTVEAVQRELCQDGFVLRYRPESDGGVDGLPGEEGAFLLCSFWLADALHGIGRTQQAQALFERLLALRNDLGLLSEEYDPRVRHQLGNTPQAFSHVGLVNTAHHLSGSPPARGM